MSIVNRRIFSWFCFIVSLSIFVSMASCLSDDNNPNPANTGGSAGTNANGDSGVGGVAGKGGNGGSAGGQAGQGGTSNGWKKGVVGKASKGVITLSHGAGALQGLAVTTSTKPMNHPGGGIGGSAGEAGSAGSAGDAGSAGASGDGGSSTGGSAGTDVGGSAGEAGAADAGDEAGVPDTTPVIDLSQITPDFTEMWFPILPYMDMENQPNIPPYTAILKPDGTITKVQHFTGNNELALNCPGTYVTEINGAQLKAYSGLSMDMAECGGKHYMVSNVGNKVWELFADGTKTVLADNLPGTSAIVCHPWTAGDADGSPGTDPYLVVTILPQYEKGNDTLPPEVAPKLMKITLDGQVSEIASLPVESDYLPISRFGMPCGAFGFTDKYMPLGISLPVALRPDGSFLFGDAGAGKIYAISEDGASITVFTTMSLLTVSAILAPNDVVYKVDSPFIGQNNDGLPAFILKGASISGFDGNVWTDVVDLTGYEDFVNNMSAQQIKVPCPPEFVGKADNCYQPWGVLAKITYGSNSTIYLMEPVTGRFLGAHLEMVEPDAGTGGSSGAGGT